MKYPQLVSTRAVSAISDWLVTQLEQLGVDASPVYSRLLLSLLHTPLQINALDLAELSDHKVKHSFYLQIPNQNVLPFAYTNLLYTVISLMTFFFLVLSFSLLLLLF